jgi:hypothetical protein
MTSRLVSILSYFCLLSGCASAPTPRPSVDRHWGPPLPDFALHLGASREQFLAESQAAGFRAAPTFSEPDRQSGSFRGYPSIAIPTFTPGGRLSEISFRAGVPIPQMGSRACEWVLAFAERQGNTDSEPSVTRCRAPGHSMPGQFDSHLLTVATGDFERPDVAGNFVTFTASNGGGLRRAQGLGIVLIQYRSPAAQKEWTRTKGNATRRDTVVITNDASRSPRSRSGKYVNAAGDTVRFEDHPYTGTRQPSQPRRVP